MTSIKDFRTEIPGTLEKYKFVFPTVNRQGLQPWTVEVSVEVDDRAIRIKDEFYDSDYDFNDDAYGVITTIIPTSKGNADYVPTYIAKGKNIGKSNATNIFTQALRDALSKYNTHRDKYAVSTNMIKPMLAVKSKFEGKSNSTHINLKTIEYFDTYIQRKYDGVRGLVTSSDGKTMFAYSRTRKPLHNIDHILKTLPQLEKGVHLDGEFYLHEYPQGKISGILNRSKDHDSSVKLKYIVYDIFYEDEPDLDYTERQFRLEAMDIQGTNPNRNYVELAITYEIDSFERAKEFNTRFITENYEGSMIRLNVPYQQSERSKRSKGLIKWKFSCESEFKICDFTCGEKGNHKGALIYVCKNNDGKEFKLPIGENYTIDEKIEAYKSLAEIEDNDNTHFVNSIHGKWITAKYAGLNEYGIPTHAQSVSLWPRDDFDEEL